MSIRGIAFSLVCAALVALALACTPAPAPPPPAAETPAASAVHVDANLLQLMRGILFPASNVIFAAQDESGINVKPADDPALSPSPLTSTYGGWNAVENSALALSEAANLLTLPVRTCSNGRAVPLQNADWGPFVQGLRDAGVTAYKAAQSKNVDNMLMAADTLTAACANCHNKYREKPGGVPDRCM